MDPYEEGRRKGQESAERGGDWRDNPHALGTRQWFEFEEGRREGGAQDVGPAAGLPPWA
ncbi:MAG: hypothetical protein KGL39_35835 [Patescibacteria group bacterium]|nr:hypothetical protein [Patescibacteria group bacterium]